MQRTSSLLLLGFIFASTVADSSTIMLGGASSAPIDEHTNEVATFAVQQLNGKNDFKKQGTLRFTKVISAKKQASGA